MQLKMHWAWLVPLLLVTTFLGSVLLTEDAVWFDEWVTYLITNTGEIGNSPEYFGASTVTNTFCEVLGDDNFTPLHMLCMSAIDNSWPPLFFGLLMFWDLFSGGVYYADRVLALLIGLVAVSLTYQMAKTMFDRKIGITAAILLGTSVFFTFYLHEIRGYTLYVLIPALNGWLYWRLLTNPNASRAIRWGFAFSIIGMLYTHYVGTGIVFGIGVYHLLIARPDNIVTRLRASDAENDTEAQNWLRILKLYINGCLVFALWIAILYISFYNESLTNRSVSSFELLWTMLRGFSNGLWYLALPLIGLSLLSLHKKEVQFLWIWAIATLFVAMVANIFADFLFHPRHVIGLMPIFMTLLAVGLATLAQRLTSAVSIVLISIWVGVGVWNSLSTNFMTSLPLHIDPVPLSAMNTIVQTSDTCATEADTFVMAWNTPDEEWVQDHIISYYLYDSPARAVTVSRIVDETISEQYVSHLMPVDVRLGGVDARYSYFIDGAERVFLFALPNDDLTAGISDMHTLLEEDGYIACDFIQRDDISADVYVRDVSLCERIVSSCTP